PDDTNNAIDVFVYDRLTETVERISVDYNGEGTSGGSAPSITGDGRYVAFTGTGTNGKPHIFVYDRQADTYDKVSIDNSGNEGNDSSFQAVMSEDGRYVAFESRASNLVDDDTNGWSDIFV